MIKKSRRRENRFDNEKDINPLSYAANLSDAMLILAVGIMLALIIHWNVDVSTTGGDMSSHGMSLSAGQEEIDKDKAVEFTERDMEEKEREENLDEGAGMSRLGEVYYDAKTGKYFVVKEE